MNPHTMNAENVAKAAFHAERISEGKPYSSVSIVLTQRSLSDVMQLDGAFELFALETFILENLADLFALAFGKLLDVSIFDLLQSFKIVELGARAEKITRCHRKPVGNKICETQNEHDQRRKLCRRRRPKRPQKS